MEIKSKEWEEIYENERVIEILTAKKKALMEMYEKVCGKKPNLNSLKGDQEKPRIPPRKHGSSDRVDSKNKKKSGSLIKNSGKNL